MIAVVVLHSCAKRLPIEAALIVQVVFPLFFKLIFGKLCFRFTSVHLRQCVMQ